MAPHEAHIPVVLAPNALPQALFHALIFIALAIIASMLLTRSAWHRKMLLGALLVVTSIQMIYHARHIAPTCPESYYTEPAWAEKEMKNLGNGRYYTPYPTFEIAEGETRPLRENLPAILDSAFGNKNAVQGFAQSYGYDSAILSRAETFYQTCFPHKMFYFSSTKYFMWNDQLKGHDFSSYPIVDRKDHLVLCRNPENLPRAWFPERIVFVPDMSAAKEHMRSLESCLPVACVEGPTGPTLEYPQDAQVSASMDSYTPHQLTIQVETDQERWLIVNDTFYPGWICTIDGHTTDIYPANLLFRAVLVPAGRHLVSFSYHPRLFQVGAMISLLAWAASLIVLAYFRH
jgi:hypothetical protein